MRFRLFGVDEFALQKLPDLPSGNSQICLSKTWKIAFGLLSISLQKFNNAPHSDCKCTPSSRNIAPHLFDKFLRCTPQKVKMHPILRRNEPSREPYRRGSYLAVENTHFPREMSVFSNFFALILSRNYSWLVVFSLFNCGDISAARAKISLRTPSASRRRRRRSHPNSR